MKRALSVHNVIKAKFKTLDFEGEWLAACGRPEFCGTWFIYGAPKNGKTSFAMMLAKYMTNFGKGAYNSIEEGLSLSIQMAMERVDMAAAGNKMVLLDKMEIGEMVKWLERRDSPDFVVIDSVQFAGLKFDDYKEIKEKYPEKLFIYVSHVDGKQPDGNDAKRIWRDANIAFRIEGFRAFPTGRYGGGEYINVSEELAANFWGLEV
ncbi:hypothetical protein QYZ87_04850 [Porphyromonadaceae bacterium W3.11]|nr:hypothetical protein [Porphyromonadaceae bacterium W3.11]